MNNKIPNITYQTDTTRNRSHAHALFLTGQTIYTIWQREIIRYWRDKTRIVSTLFMPLMFLVIFGAGLSKTLATGNFGVDFTQFMYPGIVAMSVMSVAFFSTVSTVWDREFGFLKEILVAPVSRVAVAFGKTLGATTIASIQAFVLLILAPLIGVTIHFTIIPQLVIFMLLLAFAISGMGLLISSHENNRKFWAGYAGFDFPNVFYFGRFLSAYRRAVMDERAFIYKSTDLWRRRYAANYFRQSSGKQYFTWPFFTRYFCKRSLSCGIFSGDGKCGRVRFQ